MPKKPNLGGHGVHPSKFQSALEVFDANGVPETTAEAWIRVGVAPLRQGFGGS